MKKLVRTLVTAVAVYTATSATAQYQWAVKSSGTGLAMGLGVACDASNNTYVGGGYSGTSCIIGSTTLPAATNGDGFLAKYNSSGTPLWAIRVAGAGDEDVKRVITDGTNIYVTGTFSGSITLYSTNAVTSSLTSSGSTDCYVAKYNTSGVLQWAVKYGGAGAESPKDISINTSLQRLYISGNVGTSFFAVSYNYNSPGTPLWTYGNSAGAAESGGIAADASGNCYLLASYASPTATITLPSGSYTGNNGMLLIKLNSSGSTTWVQNIGNGSSGEERGRNIGVDATGDVYIAGQYYFTADISGVSLTNANATQLDVFVAKYNSAGTRQWARKISSLGNQYINAFTVSPAGEAYAYYVNGENNTLTIGCQTHSSINGNTDNKMVIVKYSPDGVIKGSLSPSITDVNGLGANSIALGTSGTFVTTGQLNGSSIFGGTTLSMSGDMFVAQAIIYDETPIISNNFTLCGLGSSITLTPIFPSGATIKWYNSSSTLIATTPNYTTPPVAVFSSTVYYVTSTIAGCESAKLPVTVSAYSITTLLASADQTVCAGYPATITFTNVTSATLNPGGLTVTSPFVVSPLSTTNYTLTNATSTTCQVPDQVKITTVSVPSFVGTYSAAIQGPAPGCTPAITSSSKNLCSSPTGMGPAPSSTITTVFRCEIGNSSGWHGATSVGVNQLAFAADYTLAVYEVDNTGQRLPGAPNVYISQGTGPYTGNIGFNNIGNSAGFDGSNSPYFVDAAAPADPTGAGFGMNYFIDYYADAYMTGTLASFSSKIWCVDMMQQPNPYCSISKKSYFKIANNGRPNGGGFRLAGTDTGVDEENTYRSLEIYPNPTNNIAYVLLNDDDKNVQVIITDNLGKQVMKINQLESHNGELNMTNLPAGIYFYNILKNNTTYKGKIVKQ